MDLRSKTIQDLLVENQQETQKWEQYREEQNTAKSNLVEFQNKLEIDVLVPIGTKAFMPGVLYHTNEILVSHFQGYFSKITTKTALDMLEHRVNLAKNHLQKLEDEYKLFEPKLVLPMIQNDGQEIIEEYNENDEKMWRANHRESVRRMKLEEKQKKSINETERNVVEDVLEELELMEELEGELDAIEPELNDTDENLKKLISGELQLGPQKERISHYKNSNNIENSSKKSETPTETENEEVSPSIDSTEEEDDEYENILPEIRMLVESTKSFKIADRIKIFRKKLKSVKKTLTTMKIVNEADLEEKLTQLEIKETLEEIIEDMEDNEEDDEVDDEIQENETEDEEIQVEIQREDADIQESPSLSRKKYTFNENVDICYINAKDPPRKISDDRNPNSESTEIDRPALKKVEIPLVKPKIDYDPVSTFSIRFKHSVDYEPLTEKVSEIAVNFTKDVISSPFEIYKLIKHKTESISSRKGKRGGKQSKLLEVSPAPIENEKSPKPLKSILKPGLVVNYENFSHIEEEDMGEPQPSEENEPICDFSKIMGDVTEHPITAGDNFKSPEVIPQGKPAKISKFKQSRKKS